MLLAGLAVAGCDSGLLGPAPGLEYAAVTNTCGAADGPAVEFYLVPQPMNTLPAPNPHVRMYIDAPLQDLDGRTWRLSGPEAQGAAWYHSTANDFEIADWGIITITDVTGDMTVEGETQLEFPSGRFVSAGFRATWFPTNRGCI